MDESVVKHLEQTELDASAKLLLKAADLIEQRGLAKWKRCDADGRLCVYGALNVACHGKPNGDRLWESDAGKEAAHRLEHSLATFDASIWNNNALTTGAMVVRKLRMVALGG